MAQVQKEDIRRIILQAARGEFLQKGFKDTSMRTISRLSLQVGLLIQEMGFAMAW